LFEAVPVVGAIIAAIPILIVAVLQSPTTAVIALIFILLLQQVQGNIITPRIMKEQADVPQFLVPIAILAGSGIGGVLGAIIAVPMVAALRVLLMRVIAPLIRRYTGAEAVEEVPAQP
jgi:predicted PurR-regulated permease PerM